MIRINSKPLASLLWIFAGSSLASAQGFVERAAELGLDHWHESGFDRLGQTDLLMDWCQSGVAIGDIDGDGQLDVVACGGVLEHRMFAGNNGAFRDVTALTGIEMDEFERTPELGDYDGDGDLDLFLGALDRGDGRQTGHGRLFRNDGDFRFVDVTTLSGTTGFGHSIDALWYDLDLDGLLDLYVSEFFGTQNAYYRNNGDGSFSEMGFALGMTNRGSSHATAIADSDGDGYPNIFIGNDFPIGLTQITYNERDAMYSVRPDGAIEDVSANSGANQFATTMGITFGDVNYDGLLDVYKTEFSTNYLLLNRGYPTVPLSFAQVQSTYGVQNAVVADPVTGFPVGHEVGWGTLLGHIDRDPWIDLIVINGRVANSPGGQRNFVYGGAKPGSTVEFVDRTFDWDFFDLYDDRGLAVGDMDRDGDQDLFIAPVAGPLRYYENRIEHGGKSWLSVRALTTTSAPGGIGVQVKWTDRWGFPHLREIGSDAPTASQHDSVAFFGLGEERMVDVEVAFPSGITRTLANVLGNQEILVEEPLLVELERRSATTFEAGGSIIVRAFAHDASGEELDANAAVTIELGDLLPLGPVTHVRGNEFERAFRIPKRAGEHRASVRFDGFDVRVRPRFHVLSPWSPEETTIVLAPDNVRASLGDVQTVSVAPKDAFGRALGAGHAVEASIALPGGPRTVALEDVGDGRYVGTLTSAGAAAGSYPIELTIDGVQRSTPKEWTLAGAVDAANTLETFYVEQIQIGHIPASPHRMRFSIEPRDSLQRNLGPEADVTFTLTPNPGSTPVSLVDFRAQLDGDHTFLLERDPASDSLSATGLLTVSVAGVQIVSAPYAF